MEAKFVLLLVVASLYTLSPGEAYEFIQLPSGGNLFA